MSLKYSELKRHILKENKSTKRYGLVLTLCGISDTQLWLIAKPGEKVTCQNCLKKSAKEK